MRFGEERNLLVHLQHTELESEKELILFNENSNAVVFLTDKIEKVFLPLCHISKGSKALDLGLQWLAVSFPRNSYGLTIESAPAAGTKVSIWFPVQDNLNVGKLKDSKKEATKKQKQLRVVLIDDEKRRVRSAEMLTMNGYVVTKFHDSYKGMEWIKHNKHAVDLIISDLTMPGPVQGNNIHDAFNDSIPVIMISGLFDDIEQTSTYQHMLKKPVHMNALLEKIALVSIEC